MLDMLTLASIDAHRHQATSEQVVAAIGFAVRAGHQNHTAYRFVTALCMTGALDNRDRWPATLLHVMDLEIARQNGEAP